jgi:hypothetical protein
LEDLRWQGLGWGDWLGSGVTATRARQYRRFDEARAFARTLASKRKSDWVYAEEGWLGWGDWLGTGKVAPDQYRSFKAASAVGNFSAPDPVLSGKLSQALITTWNGGQRVLSRPVVYDVCAAICTGNW